MAELCNALAQRLSCSVPATAIFDHPTPAALAAFLAAQLLGPASSAQPAQAPAVRPERLGRTGGVAITSLAVRYPGAEQTGAAAPDSASQQWAVLWSRQPAVSLLCCCEAGLQLPALIA